RSSDLKVSFANDDGALAVRGLSTETRVTGGEPLDAFEASTLGGADSISSDAGVTAQASVIADGGDGQDAAEFDGTKGDDSIGIARNGSNAAVFTDPASLLFQVAPSTESLDIEGLAGNDTIAGQNGLAGITSLTLNG